jgi:hypothetical protein
MLTQSELVVLLVGKTQEEIFEALNPIYAVLEAVPPVLDVYATGNDTEYGFRPDMDAGIVADRFERLRMALEALL